LLLIEGIPGTGLDIVKNVVFSKTPIVQNVYRFDEALTLLLGANWSRCRD
jgi:hypothetical protein